MSFATSLMRSLTGLLSLTRLGFRLPNLIFGSSPEAIHRLTVLSLTLATEATSWIVRRAACLVLGTIFP